MQNSLPRNVLVAAYREGKPAAEVSGTRILQVQLENKEQKILSLPPKTVQSINLFVCKNLTPTRRGSAWTLGAARKNFLNIRSVVYTQNGFSQNHSSDNWRLSTQHRTASRAAPSRFYSKTLNQLVTQNWRDLSSRKWALCFLKNIYDIPVWYPYSYEFLSSHGPDINL